MKGRDGSQYLNPSELALLQECFDALLAKLHLTRDQPDADLMAGVLMHAYNDDVTDKFELMQRAENAIKRVAL